MCDPLSITAAVLTAGSMVANKVADNKVEKARKGALMAESIRQKGFDNQAKLVNDRSVNRYDNFQGQQEQKQGELSDFFRTQNTDATPDANASAIMPATASNIVNREQSKQQGKAARYGAQQADALGGLRSFGDAFSNIQRGQARDAAEVGQIGGFMRGSSNVVPLELQAANGKGAGLKTMADILGTAGTVVGAAGLAQGGYSLFTKAAPGPVMPGAAPLRASRLTGKIINPFNPTLL